MKAEVYSKNGCPFCVQAKMLLQMKGVEVIEHNFQTDPEKREELFERAAAINVVPRTAPQINPPRCAALAIAPKPRLSTRPTIHKTNQPTINSISVGEG